MKQETKFMTSEQPRDRGIETHQAPQFTSDAGADEAVAWEEVDTGRYMPRRIKGSCKGRALG